MFIVALTGGVATGKSTVLAIFRENGVPVIDADEVSRKVLEPGTDAWSEVKDCFGEDVVYPDGRINRDKLGEIIFNNAQKRRKLNAIMHPKIRMAMVKIAAKHMLTGQRYIVMEIPLLFETGNMLKFMHKIITVVCKDHQQLERLCKRNQFTEQVAKVRIQTQMPIELKVAKSQFVIDNTGDIECTRKQTENIINVLNHSKFPWFFRSIILITVMVVCFGAGYTLRTLFFT